MNSSLCFYPFIHRPAAPIQPELYIPVLYLFPVPTRSRHVHELILCSSLPLALIIASDLDIPRYTTVH